MIASALFQMKFVAAARRAWCEAGHMAGELCSDALGRVIDAVQKSRAQPLDFRKRLFVGEKGFNL